MSYHVARTEGAEGAPLFLTFHGTGGDETQFHSLAGQFLPDARVVSPRGDVSENGMNRYFRRTGEGIYDMDDLAQRTSAMVEFIRGERSDAQRTLGIGYSNGANILAAVAFEAPDLFDELMLMHPLIPWTPDPAPRLAGTRVLITAGRADPICPAPATESLASWFTEQGAELTLHWHSGGHEIRQDEITAIEAFID